MKETYTLSFLPALDDLEYGGELVAFTTRGWQTNWQTK